MDDEQWYKIIKTARNAKRRTKTIFGDIEVKNGDVICVIYPIIW